MADYSFQTQYVDEFIAGLEQRQSLLRSTVATRIQVKGNQAIFLVADSGGRTAVTRGANGLIPVRQDNVTVIFADEDNLFDARLLSENEMELCAQEGGAGKGGATIAVCYLMKRK